MNTIDDVLAGRATWAVALEDCLEGMPALPAACIESVMTDPPYGIKACDRSDGGVGSISSGSKFYGRQTWDYLKPPQEAFDLILALKVPTIIWGGNYFDLPPTSCFLVWDKKQRDFTFADAELAWTNLDRAVRVFDYSRGRLVTEGKVHPAQKPVPLMRWCLEQAKVPKGGIVLDPFAGSGTTGVACLLTGRRFIGYEIDPVYHAIAVKRLSECDAVPELFKAANAAASCSLFDTLPTEDAT